MEILQEKEEFLKIVKKYNLDEKEKATIIAQFIASGKTIKVEDFVEKFGVSREESKIFLNFISKGIQYKEAHIDPNINNKNK